MYTALTSLTCHKRHKENYYCAIIEIKMHNYVYVV